jgi:ABC-2 type transport system permease protein
MKYPHLFQFGNFVQKEIRHILRDKRTVMIVFALPVILVFLFGTVLNNDFKNIPVAIVDMAHDTKSEELIHALLGSGYFICEERPFSIAESEQIFRSGKVRMIIVIPQDFANALLHGEKTAIQLIADATDINTATTITNFASGIIQSWQSSLINTGLQQPISISTRMIFNERLLAVYLFIPGVITLVMTIVSAMLTSVTLAREKENGTMELLSVSPVPPLTIVAGKVLPYLFISFTNSAIILLIGYFVFGLPMNGSIPLLAGECALFTITALSLGIFISTRVDTQQAAMFASIIMLMMPTMLLSGFIFPRESMPLPLQIISNIIPATHFIAIIKSIMIKGAGIYYIWKETLILGITSVFFLSVSIILINREK